MKNTRGIVELYTNYTSNTIKDLQVSKDQFKRILSKFSSKVISKVFDAEEVKLPIIGTLRVKKIKQKYKDGKLKIDWQATKKAGKKIYHLNEHRNGYYYKIIWRTCNIKGTRLYSFKPERYHFTRPLSKLLKTDLSKDFFLD